MNWYAETHYKRLGVISFFGFISLLLMGSVFKGGVTYVEIPKIGLIVALSGYVTHKVQMTKDFPGKQKKEQSEHLNIRGLAYYSFWVPY